MDIYDSMTINNIYFRDLFPNKNSLFGKSFQLGGLEVGAPLRYFEKSQSVNRY